MGGCGSYSYRSEGPVPLFDECVYCLLTGITVGRGPIRSSNTARPKYDLIKFYSFRQSRKSDSRNTSNCLLPDTCPDAHTHPTACTTVKSRNYRPPFRHPNVILLQERIRAALDKGCAPRPGLRRQNLPINHPRSLLVLEELRYRL